MLTALISRLLVVVVLLAVTIPLLPIVSNVVIGLVVLFVAVKTLQFVRNVVRTLAQRLGFIWSLFVALLTVAYRFTIVCIVIYAVIYLHLLSAIVHLLQQL